MGLHKTLLASILRGGAAGGASFSDDDYSNIFFNTNQNTYKYEDIPLKVSSSIAFTRPANTTAYTFGDLVANNTTAGSVTPISVDAARAIDTVSSMIRCRLEKTGTSVTSAIFRVHFYNELPTVTNGDNGVWLSTQAGYVGSVDITVDKAFSDGAEGIGAPSAGSALIFAPVSGTTTLYALIEARAAYTPVSGEQFQIHVEVL